MPIIDQISTVFRGETVEQIISVSLCVRACVGAAVLVFILDRRFQYVGSIRRLGWFCTLFGVSALGAAVFRWNSEVFPYIFRILWWLVFLYATYSATQSGIVRRSVLLNAMVACATVQLLSLLATPLWGHLGRGLRDPSYTEVGAVSGLFYSTKGIAQSLALMLPIIWIRFKPGIMRCACIFAILLGVIMTFSRAAAAAALISLTVLAFTDFDIGRKKRSLLMIATPVFLSLFVAVIIMLIGWERVAYRWTVEIGSGSLGSGRLIFWSDAFLAWWKSDMVTILFGKGLGASLDILEKSYGRIWCHNDFLEILLCQGLVGLIAYLALLLCMVKILCGLRSVNQNNGPAWALLGGFLTCSFLSGTLYQLDVMTIFLVAFAVISNSSFLPAHRKQIQTI